VYKVMRPDAIRSRSTLWIPPIPGAPVLNERKEKYGASMIDTGAVKQAFKDADNAEAMALYIWATACMEVRGLIPIAGATSRKRRSEAAIGRGATASRAGDGSAAEFDRLAG